jgi:hypothetical protein
MDANSFPGQCIKRLGVVLPASADASSTHTSITDTEVVDRSDETLNVLEARLECAGVTVYRDESSAGVTVYRDESSAVLNVLEAREIYML